MKNELALFAGAGGGLLGSKLLGWRTVCAVELASYPRSVLLARQRDGHLGRFPIWDDVRTFDGHPWRGHIDVVSGGFPCQPFSSAARGRNVAVDLWPEMLRIVGEVQPRNVFAENVARAPIERAANDLAKIGYRVSIASITAAAVGAPHIRNRWWLRGDSDSEVKPMVAEHAKMARMRAPFHAVWAKPEGDSIRIPDGLANRMDRCRAAGNGQVPAMAAFAWGYLE